MVYRKGKESSMDKQEEVEKGYHYHLAIMNCETELLVGLGTAKAVFSAAKGLDDPARRFRWLVQAIDRLAEVRIKAAELQRLIEI
jgi:hypothetical protein